MRYIIDTNDEQGLIGMQIKKWSDDKKLIIIEKAEPLVEIQASLERVARALEVLKKSGYNSAVMRSWLYQQTKISQRDINNILTSQEDFFKQIGVIKK